MPCNLITLPNNLITLPNNLITLPNNLITLRGKRTEMPETVCTHRALEEELVRLWLAGQGVL